MINYDHKTNTSGESEGVVGLSSLLWYYYAVSPVWSTHSQPCRASCCQLPL